MWQACTQIIAGKARRASLGNPDEEKCSPVRRFKPRDDKLSATDDELEARCNYQPHTDEAGDNYYIGDAYEVSRCAQAWSIQT